jgi:hypothetical protein
METNEDLTGTRVLVHPELGDDPLQKRGQTGIITFADLARDDVYVTFGGPETGLYGSDALLVFKKPNDIYRDILTNTKDIPTPVLKDLYRVNMLLDSGRATDAKIAMEMAAASPGVAERAMLSLQEKFGLEIGQTETAEMSQNRGR